VTYSVEITPVSQRTCAVLRFHIRLNEMHTMSSRISHAFDVVANHLLATDATPLGPAVASFRQYPDGFDVFAGFPVAQNFEPNDMITTLEVGGCETAHTTHTGTYDKLADAYQAIRTGARVKGKRLSHRQPMWEEYWSESDSTNATNRTEIFWPVEPSTARR
jgi:effector-binding domain-containing protein